MSSSESDSPNGPDGLHAFSEGLADVVQKVAPSIVAIHARRRIPASGVIWRPGYVVASDHTLRRERDITVTLEDGRQVSATIVGRDASTDLALLKLDDDSAPAAAHELHAGASSVRTGQLVLALGRPGTKITATLGTVHTIGGEWRTWQGGQLSELIRVDMTVHDGFSGSALVDAKGNVIGINSSMLTRGAPATIPAATVDRVVDQLIAGGHIPRGWLGVGTQPVRLPEKVRAEAGLSQEVGLLIVGVSTGSPAEQAGMFVGDTLLSLAGTPTRDADDVLAILGPDTVGRTLTARIIRAGAVIELPVTIGSSPHATPPSGRGPGGGPGRGGWGAGGRHGGGAGGDRPEPGPDHQHSGFEDMAADFVAGMRERHEQHRRRTREDYGHAQHRAQAFEQFRQAFASEFARSCSARRPH
jgi:serine protease DegQ